MTLAERIQWIIDNTVDPNGNAWSARSLSREAGLAEAHVGQLLKGSEGRRDTLEGIARAAGVSDGWLVLNSGTPKPTAALTSAVDFARADGIAENVISMYCRTHIDDRFEGVTASEIFLEIKAAAQMVNRGFIGEPAAEGAQSDPPPRSPPSGPTTPEEDDGYSKSVVDEMRGAIPVAKRPQSVRKAK